MSGALYLMLWKGAAEGTEAFPIEVSFSVLFMIIIGGLGSIFGSLVGAAFIVLLPVVFKNLLVGALGWPTDIAQYCQIMLLGSLIIIFLIAEPHGIAALWRTAKEKLRLWPFPH
jgi:branched-chain amino acid transport system permease protein